VDQLLDKLSDPAWIQAIASLIATLGIYLLWRQLRGQEQQAEGTFEDGMAREYRKIIATLPVDALLGKDLDPVEQEKCLGFFYRYFDLSNEQAFLHDNKKRIRDETWKEWKTGIIWNLQLPAFRKTWSRIQEQLKDQGGIFSDLRSLVEEADRGAKHEPAPSVGGRSAAGD
jgi:ABC-type nickel/cobalt efflux system permease component RcnA